MELGLINDRVGAIALAAAAENGAEFVQSEILGTKRNPTVRVYIDKPGGVTLEDCSSVSRIIESALDADDLIPHSYTLEVSSPGLERPLRDPDDYARFAGRMAKIVVRDAVDGQMHFEGRVTGIEDGAVVLAVGRTKMVRLPYDRIARGRLAVEF